MASQLYICPKCGCPDLMEPTASALILSAEQRTAACPNCQWVGPLSEAAGIYTADKVFDTKAVLELLLYVTTKHAAGPIAQALQFVGLIDKDDPEALNVVMRAATEGMIRESFMAAATYSAEKAAREGSMEKHGNLDPAQAETLKTALEEGEVKMETFSVVNSAAVDRLEIDDDKETVH